MTAIAGHVNKEEETMMKLTEKEMLKRILNAYLRETGNHDPRDQQAVQTLSLPVHTETAMKIFLPHTKNTILGTLTYWSAGGHHAYGDTFFQETETGKKTLSFEQIVLFIMQEVSISEPDKTLRQQKQEELIRMIKNSLKNMRIYSQQTTTREGLATARFDFRYSEQSLYYGHPFHPTPKSSEGFTAEDLRKYAPEMGAAFPLHYFALSPELIIEGWVNKQEEETDPFIPEAIATQARQQLNTEYESYVLLPCHPWQAMYLLTQPLVKKLIEEKQLIDLGPLGKNVYPTSSVRTVWSPEHQCFYKLSLHIRVTNFIRENTREQLYRTLDAAKVVHCVKDRYNSENFTILLENGFRTVSIPYATHAENEQIMASFSAILREAPAECQEENTPYVIASLFEVPPKEKEPALFYAIRRQNEKRELPNLFEWLKQYLSISLQPILQLFAETGISLEAHVQNSMLRLKDGFPSKFYVRDLEGISVDREQAKKQNWVDTIISAASPVLYSNEQAWFRLKYYFFVNHLGHLVHTLARYSHQDEYLFWQTVREFLQSMKITTASPQLQSLIDDLLHSDTLPAKANLFSCFQKRGENPLYMDIPNPIFTCAL
ncbi:Siderophore synthetase component [Aneurinibacillus thermoaerophilus]|uniref:IucA/IucC family siderophore biosynthesis protein n=1 Tax=Aneurinibacillus thermoaerophilus TaxID=143495 RepID=A0A1G8EYI3_ANETH|nr:MULTISPECIES: IucA/IucC family protein [Aneurinibacillus]AMA71819.1 hypothetical protein ACH33_02505 [Aneurinibacillus sp. XH2]MED0677246.1 IucA/IucC family protein [Aneurinibacillus thermoaerophilus]QYY42417.1 IucA/IucC family siderophore biosynthesis protein [Aneurinibacillus thermoaerophilus]SDH74958.1 Siderophore synthetase component [Aneurinibacillus thermoaerophilus]